MKNLHFQGAALIGCLLGSCSVMNYKMKSNTTLFTQLIEERMGNSQLILYPCYSPSSSSLLSIECKEESKAFHKDRQEYKIKSSSKSPSLSSSRTNGSRLSILLKSLLQITKLTTFNTIVVIKSMAYSGIQDIESMLSSCKGIFTPLQVFFDLQYYNIYLYNYINTYLNTHS